MAMSSTSISLSRDAWNLATCSSVFARVSACAFASASPSRALTAESRPHVVPTTPAIRITTTALAADTASRLRRTNLRARYPALGGPAATGSLAR